MSNDENKFFRFYTSIMYDNLLESALGLVTSIVMKFAPMCGITVFES